MLLHLVRHGRSEPDPTRPASQWGLHPEAAPGVEELAGSGVLPDADAPWFSSDEPKAVQTAALLGADPAVLPALREAARPADWMGTDEFLATVRRSMQQPEESPRPGWEPTGVVQARVYAAVTVDVVPRAAAAGEAVLVGHGTSWTMLVAAVTGRPADIDAWQAMTMPDHCLLDLEIAEDGSPRTGRLVRPWGSWRAA